MDSFPARPPRGARELAVLLAVGALLLLAGCRSAGPALGPGRSEGRLAADSVPPGPIEQRIVIIVHGDASYLYHDRRGRAHQADEESLREAARAARSMPRAEVFVFHKRPKKSLLGLFRRDDGTLYHFRAGRLVARVTYEQDPAAPLSAEARLFEGRRSPRADSSLFTAALYYGHAIPERPRQGYHRSRPEVPFGIRHLAQGLGRMLGTGARTFDALVLSTCDGGTPHTIAALAPYARHVLASPGDLHLSFIDADLLASLGTPADPGRWSRRLAEGAFGRLVGRTQTAVTLATYDMGVAGPAARRMADEAPPDTSAVPAGGRHEDCENVLSTRVDTSGVRVWDRPARFGPQAGRKGHSGWGCLSQGPKR